MLASLHFPVCDLRALFQNEVGRIPGVKGPRAIDQLTFLRSASATYNRRRGGGTLFLQEPKYFDLSRPLRHHAVPLNQPNPAFIINNRVFKRYFQLDEISARFEMGFPILSNSRVKAGARLTARQIFHRVAAQKLLCDKTYCAGELTVLQSSKLVAEFIQSRTTREVFLKDNRVIESVFVARPILFIEVLHNEVSGSDLESVPTGRDRVELFHWYPAQGYRGWVILRKDESAETLREARLLRMYLSRFNNQFEVFRIMVRNVPRVAHQVLSADLDVFIPDCYHEYLTRSRRFLSSLSRESAEDFGHEFGSVAQFAHNMISPGEAQGLIDQHKELVDRGNIFKNLSHDIYRDAALGSRYNGEEQEPEGFRAKTTNLIFNLFGQQNASQSAATTLSLARPAIQSRELRPMFVKLSRIITSFSTGISESRQKAIEHILLDIEAALNHRQINGPEIRNLLKQLEPSLSRMRFGQELLNKCLEEIHSAISIKPY